MKQLFRILQSIPVGKTVRVTITSSSMEPTLLKSSSVVVTRSSLSTLIADRIIAFYIEGMDKIVIHRIVQIKQDDHGMYALTHGDANIKNDPWIVREEQVIGVLENQ